MSFEFRQVELVVTVPVSHVNPVLEALAEAGAGEIGNYSHCTFTTPGTGRFKPNEQADPTVGEKGQLNEVEEIRIETPCPVERLKAVIAAVRQVHPYEEPNIYAFPVLTLEDL